MPPSGEVSDKQALGESHAEGGTLASGDALVHDFENLAHVYTRGRGGLTQTGGHRVRCCSGGVAKLPAGQCFRTAAGRGH